MYVSENLNSDYPGAKIFLFAFTIRCLQTAVLSYSKPNKSGFWYSALPDNWKSNPWIFGLHWLFHVRVAIMFLNCFFCVIQMLLYLHTLANLLQRKYEITGERIFFTSSKMSSSLLKRGILILQEKFQTVLAKHKAAVVSWGTSAVHCVWRSLQSWCSLYHMAQLDRQCVLGLRKPTLLPWPWPASVHPNAHIIVYHSSLWCRILFQGRQAFKIVGSGFQTLVCCV